MSPTSSFSASRPVEVQEAPYTCPACWEQVTLLVDPGGGHSQEFVEDCEVCCRPLRFVLRLDELGELVELGVESAG